MDDDQVILKLTCATCDNPECEIGPKCVSVDSLVGCTRLIPEDIYDQYIHYMEEVIPF